MLKASQLSSAPHTPTNRNLYLDESYSRQTSEYMRNSAGTSIFSTPEQHANERLKSHLILLSTPSTGDSLFVSKDRSFRPKSLQTPETSPTPRWFNNVEYESGGDADLPTTVLQLLRSDNIELRTRTKYHLCHIISQEVGVYEIKLRMFEETISKLLKKLDEFESSLADGGTKLGDDV